MGVVGGLAASCHAHASPARVVYAVCCACSSDLGTLGAPAWARLAARPDAVSIQVWFSRRLCVKCVGDERGGDGLCREGVCVAAAVGLP